MERRGCFNFNYSLIMKKKKLERIKKSKENKTDSLNIIVAGRYIDKSYDPIELDVRVSDKTVIKAVYSQNGKREVTTLQ
jgi:hypothetical protein